MLRLDAARDRAQLASKAPDPRAVTLDLARTPALRALTLVVADPAGDIRGVLVDEAGQGVPDALILAAPAGRPLLAGPLPGVMAELIARPGQHHRR